jgi:broad specificity phosphatase PhoE
VLIIVRHGRTEANADGLLLGRADVPLDEVGRRQARALASALRRPDRVISSPLRRAVETAAAFDVDAEIDDRWIELDYGEFDGRPASQVPSEVWRSWQADPDYAPPGGESLRALRQRVDAASADALDGAAEENVVVVTHVSPIKAAVGWTLGLDDRVNWRTYVATASISRIGAGPVGPVLHGFNEVVHLEGLEETRSSG